MENEERKETGKMNCIVDYSSMDDLNALTHRHQLLTSTSISLVTCPAELSLLGTRHKVSFPKSNQMLVTLGHTEHHC